MSRTRIPTKTTKRLTVAQRARASRLKWRAKVKRVRLQSRAILARASISGEDRRVALALIVKRVNAGDSARTAANAVVRGLRRARKS